MTALEFNDNDLRIIHRALGIAHKKISGDIRRKKRAQEDQRRNLRPGAIAALAMEGGDYLGLYKRLAKRSAHRRTGVRDVLPIGSENQTNSHRVADRNLPPS